MDRLMIGSQFGTKTCKFVTEKHTSHISFNKSGNEAMTRIRNSITSNLSERELKFRPNYIATCVQVASVENSMEHSPGKIVPKVHQT